MPLRAALTHQQHANSLEQIHRLIHSLWKEDVGQCVALVDLHSTGDQHCRCVRGEFFDLLNNLRAIHAGHDQIREYEINPSMAEGFDRELPGIAGDHAVTARLEQDLADGECLFIVVDAKDCLLRFHWGLVRFVRMFYVVGERESELHPKGN